MSRGRKSVDVSDAPELRRLAEEVATTNEPRVLQRDNQGLAILKPAKRTKKRAARGRPVTRDDNLFRLVGIGRSGIPGGMSGKKHEYSVRWFHDCSNNWLGC